VGKRSDPEFAYSDRERERSVGGGAEGRQRKINKEDGIQPLQRSWAKMDAKELWENHDGPLGEGAAAKITLDDAAAADELFSILMGRGRRSTPKLITPQRQGRSLPPGCLTNQTRARQRETQTRNR